MPQTKVTQNEIDTGIQAAYVSNSETINTGGGWADLPTVGPSVTIVVPASGKVLVTVECNYGTNATGNYQGMGFAASGANTISPSDPFASFSTSGGGRWGMTFLLTGLNPGSTTFTAKYKSGLSATYNDRRIIVEPK